MHSMHKAVRAIREDVDDLMDAQRAASRQTLYLLHSQVKQDRAEASCQLVVQGFEPWREASDPTTAFARRDAWCQEMSARWSGVPSALVKVQCSHGTAADRLSHACQS